MSKSAAARVNFDFEGFCSRWGLPPGFAATVQRWYLPLLDWLFGQVVAIDRTVVIGLNGAQGSGKSTLAALWAEWLAAGGLRALSLSLDDLYLTRAARHRLAAEVHPLLATRGVPGTHDVRLGCELFDALARAGPDDRTPVPRFDKLQDDRLPESRWPRFCGRPDVVVIEGWCLCAPPQREAELTRPVNALERDEDPDCRWRRYVNARLKADYPPLFGRVDRLVMLAAPSMDAVYRWRAEAERRARSGAAGPAGGMSQSALQRFMMHFERLTRHQLRVLPARADWLYELDGRRRVLHCRGPV